MFIYLQLFFFQFLLTKFPLSIFFPAFLFVEETMSFVQETFFYAEFC